MRWCGCTRRSSGAARPRRGGYADENTIIVTLENTLTSVERTMRDLGEKQRLEETRLFFQNATRDEFVAAVERITGRNVRGFVSGMDADVDIATEIFYFEPRPTRSDPG